MSILKRQVSLLYRFLGGCTVLVTMQISGITIEALLFLAGTVYAIDFYKCKDDHCETFVTIGRFCSRENMEGIYVPSDYATKGGSDGHRFVFISE